MIDNDAVRQALSTLERYAPGEADVLAGMRAGIARRRRRRQVASVAGVAGAASAVALGVVLVAPGRGNDQGSTQPATSAPPPTSVRAATPLAPPVLPFSVGWVPDGFTNTAWDTGPADGSVQYSGTKDFQNVVVWVSTNPRDQVAGAIEEPTDIGGRPGVIRRLPPDRLETQLIWQLADGRWAMVGGRAPTMSLATLRKVAASVSTAPMPIAVKLGLRAAPEGYDHASWSGAGSASASVMLCRTPVESRTQLPADCIGFSLHEGTAPASTLVKDAQGSVPAKPSNLREVPVDQEEVVNGVSTRATPDGTLVYAQVDPGHWAQVASQGAGVDLLREVASNVTLN